MRYRLIHSRGRAPSWHAWGYEEARREGERAYTDSLRDVIVNGVTTRVGIPILLCEAPEGGLVRHLETIGGSARRVRR